MIIVFWALIVLTAFACVLAVQMRVLIGVVLRRALAVKFPGADDRELRLAVAEAASGGPNDPHSNYLTEAHAGALDHLRMARRWSMMTPAALLVLLAIGRFHLGVF